MKPKVILGSADVNLKVRLRETPCSGGYTHGNYGMFDDYCFRVRENVIYWWFELPPADIKDEVIAKLKKRLNYTIFVNKLLSREMVSFDERFKDAHGYPAYGYPT